MIAIRKEYEATGGHFTEYPSGTELLPGVWFTGPVPRVYPEHNWSGPGKVMTPTGLVEDNIPEDSSLVLEGIGDHHWLRTPRHCEHSDRS